MSQHADSQACPSAGAGRWSSAAGLQSPATAAAKSSDKYGSQRYSSMCDSGLGSISSGTESLRRSAAAEDEERLLQSHFRSVSLAESDSGHSTTEDTGRPPLADYAASSVDYFQQDADGDTHLHIAIIFGHADLVDRIVATGHSGSQINLRNDLQQTALHLAVSTKQPLVVRSLLAAGAELLARDWRGNTAAHLACRDGELECLRLLVDAAAAAAASVHPGASWQQQRPAFDVHNYEGLAPLHLAADGGHLQLVSCLVESRVSDVNFQEAKAGRTLLHLAVERDDQELLRLALKLGAEPGVCSYNGARPSAVARAWRRNVICELLKEFEEGLPTDSSSSGAGDKSGAAEEMEYSDEGYDDIQINGLPVAVNSL